MSTLRKLLLVFLFLHSSIVLSEASRKLLSPDLVSGPVKSKEGSAKHNKQKIDASQPEGFGTTLPAGMTAKSVVQLLAPGKDASLATLVGVKAWPHRANTYIALVCLAPNKKDAEETLSDNNGKPTCDATYGEDRCSHTTKEVHLGMLKFEAGHVAPTLVASYGKPLDITTNWKHSKLEAPACAEEGPMVAQNYSRFDFAPFRISQTETAFGIRVEWPEGQGGGGTVYQALMLFALNGSRIVNVLSEPIYYSNAGAGDWHDEDARNHFVIERENMVTFLPHQTNGFYDLQLKTKGKKWKQIFVWNDQEMRYQPANPKAPSKGKR